jgi:hypothetical protein
MLEPGGPIVQGYCATLHAGDAGVIGFGIVNSRPNDPDGLREGWINGLMEER